MTADLKNIWTALKTHHDKIRDRVLLSLFDDADRFDTYSVKTDDMLLDYSKTNLDAAAMNLLLELAEKAQVPAQRDAMFAGKKINLSEDRAVLHTALRTRQDQPILVDDQDILPDIRATRARMESFGQAIREGKIQSAEGHSFTDVVNIGIGGSDLGPAMATAALAPYHDGPACHFVSNIDAAHIHDTLAGLDPSRTLIVIVSKTFTTTETMTNAATAIAWLRAALGGKAPQHLAAVSSAPDKTAEFGIDPARVFGFGDYVGGRYSVWGPVGLTLLMAIGPARFNEFLQGGHAMDQHFRTAPMAKNLPVILGLVGVWHNNICGYTSRAILPYDQRLARLPAYLQQLDMESNGKRVAQNGAPLELASGPVVWGAPGTNGQHAFYQLLHQGSRVIPCEFMIAARGHEPDLADHHDLLKANCLAQSEALMCGRSPAEMGNTLNDGTVDEGNPVSLAGHRSFPGNRPSITLAYPKLTPFMLGQIIALYEHRVFVEGTIWGLNSFDQWGVELGKELANTLLPMVRSGSAVNKDGSTTGLIRTLSS